MRERPADTLVESGVPRWLATEAASNVLRSTLLAKVESWSLTDGFYFHGELCGTGKSLVMAALALRQLRAGQSVVWANMYRLLESLRDRYGTGRPEAQELDRYRSARVLMLDDIGIQDRDHERLILYGILEYRDRTMVTCATGNYSPEVLAEHIDDRVRSRLLGLCRAVEIVAADSGGNKIDFRVQR